jgi:hypothetical protein
VKSREEEFVCTYICTYIMYMYTHIQIHTHTHTPQHQSRLAAVKSREEEVTRREMEVAEREKALKALELCEGCGYRRDEASLKSDADTTADVESEKTDT